MYYMGAKIEETIVAILLIIQTPLVFIQNQECHDITFKYARSMYGCAISNLVL
jgi:hypothetical protein